MKVIRVLIVDDSSVFRCLLKALLESEGDIKVIGEAANGEEGTILAQQLKPDLVTMDILMPVMNGIEATRQIMSTIPTPIIIITSSTPKTDQTQPFRAIEAGALAAMDKPPGYAHPNFAHIQQQLLETVRIMSEVAVVQRHNRTTLPVKPDKAITHCAIKQPQDGYELIAIGCSTGGPQALQILLSELPKDLPVPVVIILHISPGFIAGLAQWLNNQTALNVQIAHDHQQLEPGCIYLPPDAHHLLINRHKGKLYTSLSSTGEINHLRPSVDIMFLSMAQTSQLSSIAILLTGMGTDGVNGFKALHNSEDNCHTIVQDEQSAVVWGMPGNAVEEGVVDQIVQLHDMAGYLVGLVKG